jgi:hypothetical protein
MIQTLYPTDQHTTRMNYNKSKVTTFGVNESYSPVTKIRMNSTNNNNTNVILDNRNIFTHNQQPQQQHLSTFQRAPVKTQSVDVQNYGRINTHNNLKNNYQNTNTIDRHSRSIYKQNSITNNDNNIDKYTTVRRDR